MATALCRRALALPLRRQLPRYARLGSCGRLFCEAWPVRQKPWSADLCSAPPPPAGVCSVVRARAPFSARPPLFFCGSNGTSSTAVSRARPGLLPWAAASASALFRPASAPAASGVRALASAAGGDAAAAAAVTTDATVPDSAATPVAATRRVLPRRASITIVGPYVRRVVMISVMLTQTRGRRLIGRGFCPFRDLPLLLPVCFGARACARVYALSFSPRRRARRSG